MQNAGPAGLNSRFNAAAVMRIARAVCEPIHQLLLQERAHMPLGARVTAVTAIGSPRLGRRAPITVSELWDRDPRARERLLADG